MINIVKKYGKPSMNLGGGEYGPSASGTFSTQTGSEYSINLGFKPKYLAISRSNGSSSTGITIYNENYSTTAFRYANGNTYAADVNLGGSTGGQLKSIDSDGFTMNPSSSINNFDYLP